MSDAVPMVAASHVSRVRARRSGSVPPPDPAQPAESRSDDLPAHSQPTRVFILDGHRIFAEALADALGASTELRVVGLATQIDEARDRLEVQDVDVILVDPSTVPGLCWPDLRRWAGRGCIAVLADEMTDVDAVAVHGVRGWFGKNQELSVLVDTLPGLASGLACFPPERLRLELDDLTRRLDDLERGITTFSRLTPREREVLSCLLDGRERREIAGELHLSPDTVRTHVEHLLVKIGAHSTLSAVALAHRYGWDGLLHLREEKRCVPADVGFFGNR